MNTLHFIDPLHGYGDLQQHLTRHDGWLLLMDENTREHCREVFLNRSGLSPDLEFIMGSGEEHKSLATSEKIWEMLTNAGAGRNYALVNLGGGVVSDVGGFAASVYKRGISFYHVPTTLLSMVDAAAGGKTGVNFKSFKNHIGSFQLPVGTWIDESFLSTLSDEEISSGFAEMLKHGLIADAEHFQDLLEIPVHSNFSDWTALIRKSVEIKASICARDPKEMGERKKLNFGHTIGHAFESWFNKKNSNSLKHGYAIAAGMICETMLSRDLALISSPVCDAIVNGIQHRYPRLVMKVEEISELIPYLQQDKKNLSGEFRFSLLRGVGDCIIDQPVEVNQVLKVLRNYFNHS